jgi:hypothetical protein
VAAKLLEQQRVLVLRGLGLDTVGGVGGRDILGRELLNFGA